MSLNSGPILHNPQCGLGIGLDDDPILYIHFNGMLVLSIVLVLMIILCFCSYLIYFFTKMIQVVFFCSVALERVVLNLLFMTSK